MPLSRLFTCGRRSVATQQARPATSTVLHAPAPRQPFVVNTANPAAFSVSMNDKRKRYQREQQIVQLVFIAQVGPQLRAHRVDRRLVQATPAIFDLPAGSPRRSVVARARRAAASASSRYA